MNYGKEGASKSSLYNRSKKDSLKEKGIQSNY